MRKTLAVLVFVFFTCLLAGCGGGGSGSNLTKETEHFIIHYTESDQSCIDAVAARLEGNQKRICDDLRCTLNYKVTVTIYPNITAYHQAMGNPGASDGFIGNSTFDGKIMIVSPLHPGSVHTYNSVMQAMDHEFTHSVMQKVLGKGVGALPLWIHEGVACYESGQMNEATRQTIANDVDAGRIPTFASFGHDPQSFADSGGYTWTYTIIDFAVNVYGYDKLRQWIDNNGDISASYGMSEGTFRTEWITYLQAHY